MPQARRLRLVVLVHMPLGHRPPDDADASRGSARSSRPPPRSSRPARGPGAGCSSCTRCPPTGCTSPSPASTPPTGARDRGRRRAALRRRGDVRQGPRRAARRAGDDRRTCPGSCACVGSLDRDPAFVERLRRRSRDGGLGDRVPLPGTADRSRSRPQLRRRRPAGAGVARRDVRHGRHRGAGPRAAGRRRRRRRAAEALGHGADGTGRGCWSRRTTRPRSPPRCGLARRRRAASDGCGGPPASGASAARLVDHHVRGRTASWPRRRDDRRGRPAVSPSWLALREPADAAARATRARRSTSGDALPASGRLGDPRPRLRHRLDGPLARATAGRAAALGRARPRRGPAGVRGRRRARPGRRRRAGHRRDEAVATSPGCTRGDLAGATLITASALLDLLTADEVDRLVAAAPAPAVPVLLTLSVIGRVELTPAIRWTAAWPPRSMPTNAARRSAAACSARTPSRRRRGVQPTGRRGPRPAQPLATRRRAGRPGGGVVHRLGGCRVRAAGRAGRRDRRLRAPASGAGSAGQLAVTVGHADLLVLPRRRRGQSVSNRGESA